MSYEILRTADGPSIIHITTANFNLFKGWRVEFDDGKEALLYNSSDEFMQYNEEWLNSAALAAIGECIYSSMKKKTPETADCYFYDMLTK